MRLPNTQAVVLEQIRRATRGSERRRRRASFVRQWAEAAFWLVLGAALGFLVGFNIHP